MDVAQVLGGVSRERESTSTKVRKNESLSADRGEMDVGARRNRTQNIYRLIEYILGVGWLEMVAKSCLAVNHGDSSHPLFPSLIARTGQLCLTCS